MSSYDDVVLGIGNPHHPANKEELEVVEPETLEECLEHYRATGDSFYLEEAVETAVRILASTRADMVALVHLAREVDNTLIANKLSNLRKKLEL